jgi:hypothetical protein
MLLMQAMSQNVALCCCALPQLHAVQSLLGLCALFAFILKA